MNQQEPTEVGRAALRPQPMSPAEVADLVERTRSNGAPSRGPGFAGAIARRERPDGRPSDDVLRAVRYARLHGVTIRTSAREYAVAPTTVRRHWKLIYPGVPTQPHLRAAP